MATNTVALKTFAQETRKKLISLISTKMDFILTQDTAELRGFESQIAKLKSTIASKGKELVVEEVAYTWFNRVMALRYMDANGDVSVGTIINLKSVDFADFNLTNVRATVVRNQKAPLLLGQSVLGRLGRIEIDNHDLVLRITHSQEY